MRGVKYGINMLTYWSTGGRIKRSTDSRIICDGGMVRMNVEGGIKGTGSVKGAMKKQQRTRQAREGLQMCCGSKCSRIQGPGRGKAH